MISMNKHDALVEILAGNMRGKTYKGMPMYSVIVDHFGYKVLGDGSGEADIIALARDKKYAVVVEVKTHDTDKSRAKAYRQLNRVEKYVRQAFGTERVFKIYAYWQGNNVKTEWVR